MKKIFASEHPRSDLPRRGFRIAEAAIYMGVTPWYVTQITKSYGKRERDCPRQAVRIHTDTGTGEVFTYHRECDSEDTITIRHSIPTPSGSPQNGRSDDPNGQTYLLCKRRDLARAQQPLSQRGRQNRGATWIERTNRRNGVCPAGNVEVHRIRGAPAGRGVGHCYGRGVG